MKSTIWKKYESDGNDGFPKDITVEICEELGDKVDFDKEYSQFYFIPKEEAVPIIVKGDDGRKLEEPKGVKKSREWVENKIYEVCEKQKWEAVDIFRILAWKTGKINHPDSKDTNPTIQYYENWKEGEKLQIPYQIVVEWDKFEPIYGGIKDIRKKYCESKDCNSAWKSIWKLANDDKNKDTMRGIGTVYLITLLHFITDGELPIYDRFAMASLAIWKLKREKTELNITDESVIRGCKLPSKKEAENILDSGIYVDYKRLLKEFCKANYGNEYEWKKNRDVDRALWVFGHFFEVD